LEKEHISYVADSSNETDEFLRNRIRHHVMPLLKQENPSLPENLSAAALGLRQDEEVLEALAQPTADVALLRQMVPAVQTRVLAKLLVSFGVKEPEGEHIELLRRVVCSENPSAYGVFPGNVLVGRRYDTVVSLEELPPLETYALVCPGETVIPELGMKAVCRRPGAVTEGLLLRAGETLTLRSRKEGDRIQLPGGTKTLKKLFIDKKIPAWERSRIPVLADEQGIVAVMGIGTDCRYRENPNWEILFESM